jgi:adenine deaminase
LFVLSLHGLSFLQGFCVQEKFSPQIKHFNLKMNSFTISGNLVDVLQEKIYPAEVSVQEGKIASIKELAGAVLHTFILPGFIDSHVHVESSMLIPSEFARLAVVHGTVATVSDPHEIANVLGVKGIRYMIANGKKVPFKFYFGASSCVPATSFETAGAEVTAEDIRKLFTEDGLHYLSEMMNYPGVLHGDPVVMEKIKIAKELNKPVDGHAPGLRGEEAKKYIDAGITTDHECFTLDEALDKLKYGMNIIIREGSAAKNYEALHTIIPGFPQKVMFCSDDKHPNDLVTGHIDSIVKRSIQHGYKLFDVLRCACVNPVFHYNLDVGLLRVNDPADFIVVNNLSEFSILKTYIEGRLVAENGKTLIKRVGEQPANNFKAAPKQVSDFAVNRECGSINVIEALEGELITNKINAAPLSENGNLISNTSKDILKLAVVNRYGGGEKPAVAFIKGFGLKKGAIASCVAHDSHNIIAVGVTDEDIRDAVNAVILSRGGISVAWDGKTDALPLPVAGIMTNEDGYIVAEKYSAIDALAKQLGTSLNAPFMTLSFMALLVIPSLKLSDKGLFDGSKFEFTGLCS